MKKALTSMLSRTIKGLSFLAIFLFCSSIFFIHTGSLRAQDRSGVISGECDETATGAPLPGVTVRVMLVSDTTFVRYAFTNSVGKYRFKNLFLGKYIVKHSILGYEDELRTAEVTGTEPLILKIEMNVQPLSSQNVIVTASRHEEKETHSPSSISVVSSAELRDQVDATPADALKNVPGIDVSSEGIATSTYASREFHSVYGSDMLTMNDYHALEVPSLAVYYGILIPQTMDDIDHVEVVRGPGSALYGPEAATGVVNFISKSPFASQGTNLSISGGERDYLDASFRHDESIGDKFAFNISGHYLSANDWTSDDPNEDTARKYAQQRLNAQPILTQSQADSLSRIGARDYNLQVYSLNARADAILSDDLTAYVTAGLTNIGNDIAMTEDFGDAQIKNWLYEFVQGRVTYKDLFIQASANHDNTSGSYFLPTGAPLIDKSSTYVAQIQEHWDPMQNEKLTFGADYKAIVPISDSSIYGPDDGHANTQLYGAYLQSQTSLLDDALEIVLAARVDKDQNEAVNLAPIFSPRVAAVYHFDDNNLVRAMYNNTYLLPTEVDLFSDLLYQNDPFGLSAYGLTGPNMRYVTSYVSGMNFVPNTDGSYLMGSTFLGPTGGSATFNTNSSKLWSAIMGLAANLGKQPLLSGVPAPPAGYSFTNMAYLNLNTKAFVPTAAPIDIGPVQPQEQRTLEMDYQGAVSKSFQFEVDAYQTHYTAVRATTADLTPSVFIDSAKTEQYLDQVFTADGVPNPDATAQAVAHGLTGVPIGVIQPTTGVHEAYPGEPYDVLVGTRSYLQNVIEFSGVDFFSTYKANDNWSFDGSFSWLNKNYWYAGELNPNDSTAQNPFALNIPKYRASIGAKYSGLARGLSIEVRDRWSDAFPMYDNYWVGNVTAAHTLDLTVNYRIESWNSLQLTLSVTNLLNNMHQEFVGAPVIGRLAVLRASYALPSL